MTQPDLTPGDADRPLPWNAQAKYQTLFESIDEGFCVVEVLFDDDARPADYRFLEVNPSFERQTGLINAVGQHMRDLAPDHEEHWFELYGEVARSGRPIRFERQAEALGRWYDVYAFRVGEPAQHLVAILFHDVSERKRIERQLQEADRRKDEFLAILAHELRNPLAPLRNGLEILKVAKGDAAMVERMRLIMERQVDHMVALVDDLMDVSRISRGLVSMQRRRLDLASIVRHAIEAAEPTLRQREHELVVHLPADEVHVDADAARMAQALANLLVNAAKYTDPGGRVSLSVKKDEREAVICVSDNGIGIEAEMLERVFELFTQAEPGRRLAQGGLGIGLALVKHIVSMHDGSVQAHSAGLGNGSELTVRLPLAAKTPDEAAAQTLQEVEPTLRRRVLVADDNSDVAQSMGTLLQLLGHEVHVVYGGEQAVEAVQQMSPEIVLLDLGMPRMDGIAAAQRIRALPSASSVTLVAVTGWGQEGDRCATRAAGFDHHLVKPIRLEALRQIMDGLSGGTRPP
ncbi:hybrid sensor histidine kinase/response regulator [Azohydromonas lata]|uniref:hybrid sensor histidine kinase/response regulator n=1 Tax=Azohydromonas lata TaxID=45677 RepID=UPI000A0248BE|nr:ATP-binding protein [Azohydromonas lata]